MIILSSCSIASLFVLSFFSCIKRVFSCASFCSPSASRIAFEQDSMNTGHLIRFITVSIYPFSSDLISSSRKVWFIRSLFIICYWVIDCKDCFCCPHCWSATLWACEAEVFCIHCNTQLSCCGLFCPVCIIASSKRLNASNLAFVSIAD